MKKRKNKRGKPTPPRVDTKGYPLTKTGVANFCKRTLANEAVNVEIFGDKKAFLCELLQKHNLGKRKIKGRITNVCVTIHKAWNTRCFAVKFDDGTKDTISFKSCIFRLTYAQKRKAVSDALRYAFKVLIGNSIFKAAENEVYCPLSKKWLPKIECEIDHYDCEFAELVTGFCMQIAGKRGGSMDFAFEQLEDVDGVARFPARYEEEFVAYHNANTHTRLIAKSINRTLGTRYQQKCAADSKKR